jgi:hypothetical protein
MEITVDYPLVPPSLNELRGKYKNPHAYKRLRESLDYIVAYGTPRKDAVQLLNWTRQKRPVKITVKVFHNRSRRLDFDGLVGGLKPFFDILKQCGFIVDDGPKWLQHGEHSQELERDPRKCRTVVTFSLLELQEKSA